MDKNENKEEIEEIKEEIKDKIKVEDFGFYVFFKLSNIYRKFDKARKKNVYIFQIYTSKDKIISAGNIIEANSIPQLRKILKDKITERLRHMTIY